MKKYRYSRLMDIEDPSTWGEEYLSILELFSATYGDMLKDIIPNGVKLIESLEKQEKDER